jgi:hypothetical protein
MGLVGKCYGSGNPLSALFYLGHSPKLPPPHRGKECSDGLGVRGSQSRRPLMKRVLERNQGP